MEANYNIWASLKNVQRLSFPSITFVDIDKIET